MKKDDEIYLGDGLYASHDGYQVKLRAPRLHGDDEVYLEKNVLINLMIWLINIGAIKCDGKLNYD